MDTFRLEVLNVLNFDFIFLAKTHEGYVSAVIDFV